MDNIVLNINNLNDYARRIANVNARISKLDNRLTSLYGMEGWVDLWNLIQSNALTYYCSKLRNCQLFLQNTAQDFITCENELSSQNPVNFSLYSIIPVLHGDPLSFDTWSDFQKRVQLLFRSGIGIGLIGYGEAETCVPFTLESFWNGDMVYEEDETTWSLTPKYGEIKDKKINRIIKQDKKELVDNLPDDKFYDKPKATIFETKVEEKKEGNLLEEELGDSRLSILHREAYASASGGLYVYSKEGKKLFSPSVSAEVGMSFSAFEVATEGRIGLGEDENMLGIYGDVEAAMLSAEVKGKVSLNSKQAYVSAGAEANAVELEATGGVSVLGTDIGISGSVKVGIGAHADIGFTDGKFKVDVGASLGLGIDIGFEVDVSGTIDAVADFASDAWEGTKDFFSDVGDGISDFFGGLF